MRFRAKKARGAPHYCATDGLPRRQAHALMGHAALSAALHLPTGIFFGGLYLPNESGIK
jgi:hypothetical protein